MSARSEEIFVVQLALLAEAGGKVQATLGKALRWGLGTTDMVSGQTHREALLNELDELKISIGRVERALVPVSAMLGAPPCPNEVQPVEAVGFEALSADGH